jgi:hypothetical protein
MQASISRARTEDARSNVRQCCRQTEYIEPGSGKQPIEVISSADTPSTFNFLAGISKLNFLIIGRTYSRCYTVDCLHYRCRSSCNQYRCHFRRRCCSCYYVFRCDDNFDDSISASNTS